MQTSSSPTRRDPRCPSPLVRGRVREPQAACHRPRGTRNPKNHDRVLCSGGLRAYKNIDVLLEVFAALTVDDVALMIAGLANDAKIAQRLRAAATADPRVQARLELNPRQ